MIKVIKDIDLFDHVGEYDVVLLATNTYCTMSNGLQLNVMLNYPYVYDKNLETKYGDPEKLGTLLECKKDGEPTFCLCFICEGNFRPDLRKDYLHYESLEKCLKLANVLYRGKNVATTYMGCSRFDGNGEKDKIIKLFEENMTSVNLTIYDYHQKSRDEQLKEIREKELAVKAKDRKAYYEMVAKRKKEADERFRKNGHRRY
jgi:hypothetical protein